MKKLALLLLLLLKLSVGQAQFFEVDTLHFSGDGYRYINIVIMGDGFTAAEQGSFITGAASIGDYLLAQEPLVRYRNYFNVFAVKAISAESGADHPETAPDCPVTSPVPVSNPNTYFGCAFDAYDIHRLIVPMNQVNVAAALAANFPAYDQVIILSNTPYYGGSGGMVATLTYHTASNEIAAHEFGHSFAGVADEYYAGDGYASERLNMTQQTDPALVKWKNWLGHNGTGIYQHCCDGNSAQWYKPHQDCKMEYLGAEFCPVCSQAIIETIHDLTDPIVRYEPLLSNISSAHRFLPFKFTELMKPEPSTLSIKWQLNGQPIAQNTDSVMIDQNLLPAGQHTLSAIVTDTTQLVRVNGHANIHLSSATWTIHKTVSGTALSAQKNKIGVSVFPNPATDNLTISVELQKESELKLELVSADGKTRQLIKPASVVSGKYSQAASLKNLPAGAYLLVFTIDGLVHTERLVKQ